MVGLTAIQSKAFDMARLFEIVPTTALIHRDDGSVEHDDRVMYVIGEDAEQALDSILEPYGEIGGWYLDKMQVRSPGPWAFVALRREYDIADYVITQRKGLGGSDSFKFTIYDARKIGTDAFAPKVACFLFFSKNSIAAAAEKIRFLRPAWALLRDKPAEQHWLVLLDEEPGDVMSEAAST
jgi:hypothetical protein